MESVYENTWHDFFCQMAEHNNAFGKCSDWINYAQVCSYAPLSPEYAPRKLYLNFSISVFDVRIFDVRVFDASVIALFEYLK